ncbi:translocase of outer mitochondrial membrane [Nowakowskiella sp. JEL0078]|nr:translocase of outer mitochondrial membrane [Nowakowskiella sp. JEL0078]
MPSSLLTGQLDHEGNLSARANYSWIPNPAPEPVPQPAPGQPQMPPTPPASNRISSTSKIQMQLMSKQVSHNTLQFEHDYVGSDFAINIKAINPNPIDKAPSYESTGSKIDKKITSGSSSFSKHSTTSVTGIFSTSYLQSISKSWAIGAEYQYQRMTPENEESSLTYAVRWAPPATPLEPPPGIPAGIQPAYFPVNPKDFTQVLTTTYQPQTGLLHSSYWRKLNQRLEIGGELQALITGGPEGRREGIANVGFKVDTAAATIRGSVDSQGRVCSFIDEKLTPGLSLQLSGELDYGKSGGGQGRVGIGFVFEA